MVNLRSGDKLPATVLNSLLYIENYNSEVSY